MKGIILVGGSVVLGHPVKDPRTFVVVNFDAERGIAADVEPSASGDLEIAFMSNAYLEREQSSVEFMAYSRAWLDAGTPEGLLEAAEYVGAVQSRQGCCVACLKEIAYRRGFIGADRLRWLGEALGKTDYGRYLVSVADEDLR